MSGDSYLQSVPKLLADHGVVVGTPGVVVCIDHRNAAMCHRHDESGLCICRPNFDVKTGKPLCGERSA